MIFKVGDPIIWTPNGDESRRCEGVVVSFIQQVSSEPCDNDIWEIQVNNGLVHWAVGKKIYVFQGHLTPAAYEYNPSQEGDRDDDI